MSTTIEGWECQETPHGRFAKRGKVVASVSRDRSELHVSGHDVTAAGKTIFGAKVPLAVVLWLAIRHGARVTTLPG
jgi:hypothetical protein